MFKKTSDDVKKYFKLSIKFSSFFREILIQNQAKNMEDGFVHKHRQIIDIWSAFCSQTSNFLLILVPRGALGTSRQPRRSLPFFHLCSAASGNRPGSVPGRSQGGPREAPGAPQAPPAQHFGSILDRFSGWISTLAIFGDLLNFCIKCLLLFV